MAGRPSGGHADLVLGGDCARVELRYCTLDPGGVDAMGAALPPVELVITGNIDELVIEHSIVPAIRLQGALAGVDQITIRDSIVDARLTGGIVAPRCNATLARCTLIGAAIGATCLDVEKLDATDTLISDVADVTDLQSGCFRFSLARGPLSRVPFTIRIGDGESAICNSCSHHAASSTPTTPPLSPRAGRRAARCIRTGFRNRRLQRQHRPDDAWPACAQVCEECVPFGRLRPDLMAGN